MNRKEGIIVGVVMLATFVGGAFAEPPAAQLLNVFVTNFPANQNVTVTKLPDAPQNVVMKVLEENVTAETLRGAPQYVFSSPLIDVSQFSRVSVLYQLRTSIDFSAGQLVTVTTGLLIGFGYTIFDATFEKPQTEFPDCCPSLGLGVRDSISHSIDGPFLRAIIGTVNIEGCQVLSCSGTIKATITLYLQR